MEKSFFVGFILALLCVVFGQSSFAESPRLDLAQEPSIEEHLLLVVFSSQDQITAIQIAKTYARQFPSTSVFQTKNGNYAVILGNVGKIEGEAIKADLISSGTIPSDTYLSKGDRFVSQVWPNEASPSPSQPSSKDKTEIVTGTGFVVAPDGYVLTNFHVVGHCKSISLRRTGQLPVPAELVASDSKNDLALIKAKQTLVGTVAKFSGGPSPRAGSDIAVFGFPLSGILSESGNIVTGNITSLAGLGNDSGQFQISAPVQPGNSGGPVLDSQGGVVAVVVSKLDTIKAAQWTGDISQNVNFAIKANVAMNFLDGVGVSSQKQDTGQILDTPTIADLAHGFTLLIECQN